MSWARLLSPVAAVAVAACGDVRLAVEPDAMVAGDAAGPVADAQLPDAAPDAELPAPGMLGLSGDISPVHDPAIIATATGFHLFATGQGIAVFESPDLLEWTETGQVFAVKPPWITTTDPGSPNHLWAPDVSQFGGQYHLYYSASRFGSNSSCIGHATSPSLEPANWVDDGAAVICSSGADNYNAIDPAAIIDEAGQPWLAFGSFWGGLKLIPLAMDGRRQGADIHSLATRSNTAVEAPFIIRRDGFYYLFESVDFCCRGVDSTYRIMVGRSSTITGPYTDRVGTPLLSGGGTLVVEGDGRWRGPGHNAVLETATGTYNVYHAYDADRGGAPTLRIAEVSWTADGWPSSSGP